MNYTYKNIFKEESGFVFTATATVISVILGLTILFMTNTIRSESVRVAELYSAQSAYWEAMTEVQVAATMIQYNGTSVLPHIGTYFPNITVTQIDQTNMTISSTVSRGNANAGAERSASINLTSPVYSIIEQVSGDFDINGMAQVDGGNLYIGGDVDINNSWLFLFRGYVGTDSTVHFFLPTGNNVSPLTPAGSNDYTVTNVAPISIPGFDASAYQTLLNYAGSISSDNPSVGEWDGNETFISAIDLQNISFNGGGALNGLGTGIFINGDLTIDALAGGSIVDNNSASTPGFIVVNGSVIFDSYWSWTIPTLTIPDNVIVIASGDVEFDNTSFGSTAPGNHNLWSNYTNEIFTQSDIEITGWSNWMNMFGQFHVFGSFDQAGWFSNTAGIIYVPNATANFGSFFSLFPDFDGTMYIRSEDNDRFSWAADINLDSRTTMARGLSGGIVQPSSIPWIILGGSFREI